MSKPAEPAAAETAPADVAPADPTADPRQAPTVHPRLGPDFWEAFTKMASDPNAQRFTTASDGH